LKKQGFLRKSFVKTFSRKEEARTQMARYIYPRYYELEKSAPVLARKAIIRAYEELGNISEVARIYRTTRDR